MMRPREERSREDFEVPIPEDVQEAMRKAGRALGKSFPKGWGFALLVFNFGPGGSLTYMANAQREDMIKVMREFIALEESKKRRGV